MIREGAVVLLRFPHTDGQGTAKMRPALVLRSLLGGHDDWLVCMLSTKTDQRITDIDEIITTTDADFPGSGLKATSTVRICRLAVAHESVIAGPIGVIGAERLDRVRTAIARWIGG